MKRTVHTLSLAAIGLWLLVVVLAFGVAVLLPGLRGTVLASIALFALGGLVASAAWILGMIDSAGARRWGWLAALSLPGLAFTAIALLALGVLPDFRGDDPLVTGLFVVMLLAPAATWLYSQGRPVLQAPPRALSTAAELLRPARWDSLSAAEHSTLLAPYGAPATDAPHDRPYLIDHVADVQTQDWVARLVAPQFQKEAASVIRTWLAAVSPNTHLLVLGRAGFGKTSLVASLARQAMAGRPASQDFCSVPDPDNLGRPRVLTLPPGAAQPFARALRAALARICESWDPASQEEALLDDLLSPSADRAASDEIEDEAGRRSPNMPTADQLARYLDPVKRVAPQVREAQEYLRQLQAALERLAATGEAPEFCEVEVPVRRVGAGVGRDGRMGGPQDGAPVVVFSSMRERGMLDALNCANGGVLVVPSSELVDASGLPSSDALALQIVLNTGALPDNPREPGSPSVPYAVRVALIVTGDSIRALSQASDEFYRTFRTQAWFEGLTDWTPEAEAVYAALADGVARRYDLPRFDPTGVARLVEEGARRVGGGAGYLARFKLTTNLLELHDLATEAGKAARARGAPQTTGADVEAAVERRRTEYGLYARLAREAILSGREIVPTAGVAVGQINCLGVSLVDPFEASYGAPSRISVVVSPGREERLVDVEREADAADDTHVIGALTMVGYLAERYGREHPVSAVVRIRFEQSYAESGSSASAAELFALLSRLAGAPIYSSLAVTGAIGQYGEIQPIGGVNHKIEGFWEICRKRRGLGERPQCPYGYGVLIPEANANDLMLRREVAESIASEGWFHVWPIRSVDEGLPLLTGLPAEAIHRRVERQLQRFYRLATRGRAW
jgi:hypothetical protein